MKFRIYGEVVLKSISATVARKVCGLYPNEKVPSSNERIYLEKLSVVPVCNLNIISATQAFVCLVLNMT